MAMDKGGLCIKVILVPDCLIKTISYGGWCINLSGYLIKYTFFYKKQEYTKQEAQIKQKLRNI